MIFCQYLELIWPTGGVIRFKVLCDWMSVWAVLSWFVMTVAARCCWAESATVTQFVSSVSPVWQCQIRSLRQTSSSSSYHHTFAYHRLTTVLPPDKWVSFFTINHYYYLGICLFLHLLFFLRKILSRTRIFFCKTYSITGSNTISSDIICLVATLNCHTWKPVIMFQWWG